MSRRDSTLASVAGVIGSSTDALGQALREYDETRLDDHEEDPWKLMPRQVLELLGTDVETVRGSFEGANYFHGTRALDPEAFRRRGIFPLDKVVEELWETLRELVDGGISDDEWAVFRRSVEADAGGHDGFLYRLKTGGRTHFGPFGLLVREIFLDPQATGSHDYLGCPEIVQDIARSYQAAYASDLEQRFRDVASPCIVTFRSTQLLAGAINAALWYAFTKIRDDEITTRANWSFDGAGASVPSQDVVDRSGGVEASDRSRRGGVVRIAPTGKRATLPTVARITLPDPASTPALRGSLETAADFRVTDLGGSDVDVEPAEGAGATRAFLRAHRLCDAGTAITPAVWAPLAEHPGYEGNPERRQRLLEQAAQFAQIETAPAMLQAIEAAVGGFGNDELPGWLELQLDRLFQLFPLGSLWLVSVDPVLLTRLTLLGGTFALEVTPDFPLDPNNVHGFDALDENSLTRGVAFGKALDPALLAFSPGAVGYAFDRQPHALVLLFGFDAELREEPPRSLSSLYEPMVFETFSDPPWDDPAFRENLDPSDIESLLQWWVSRLNVFYSHAADPTRFVDDDGKHDPLAQRAWFLTFERMLADGTLILAAPQLAALARMAAAFDLLDKAEALLGYGRDGEDVPIAVDFRDGGPGVMVRR